MSTGPPARSQSASRPCSRTTTSRWPRHRWTGSSASTATTPSSWEARCTTCTGSSGRGTSRCCMRRSCRRDGCGCSALGCRRPCAGRCAGSPPVRSRRSPRSSVRWRRATTGCSPGPSNAHRTTTSRAARCSDWWPDTTGTCGTGRPSTPGRTGSRTR